LESKGTFVVLLLIIVVLTVAIAIMAGFMLFSGGPVDNRENTVTSKFMPSDKEISPLELYNEKQVYNLKSDNENPNPVIQIDVTLWYFNKVKGVKNVREKIENYRSKIKEAIGVYFNNITLTEIKNGSKGWETIKEELKEQINEILNENSSVKREIIYEVVFDEWFYQ